MVEVPLNSVQNYVAGLLDGLEVPIRGTKPVEAHITPPTFEDIDGPKAYVWGGRHRGHRQTMPRNSTGQLVDGKAGFKELNWDLDIYLAYETTADAPFLNQEFPCIVDAVLTKLWTTPVNRYITDPITGVISQITQIGEDWHFEMLPERTPNTLRMVFYTARITAMITEEVQG